MEIEPFFLFAEDDPDDQFMIRVSAQEACPPEIQMHFVQDGMELMDFLHERIDQSSKPSLIILDLNMPRKDGRVALREIKAHPDLMDIPTVILTTSSAEEDVRYCQSFGIHGYYRKPDSINELRDIMAQLCKQYYL